MTSSGAHRAWVHCCTFCRPFTAAWHAGLCGFCSLICFLLFTIVVTCWRYFWCCNLKGIQFGCRVNSPTRGCPNVCWVNKTVSTLVNLFNYNWFPGVSSWMRTTSPTFTICVLVPVVWWNSCRAVKYSLLHLFQKRRSNNAWTLALFCMSAASL